MVEYLLIVGLIAIGAIGAADAFGAKLRGTYGRATSALDNHVTKKVGALSRGGSGSVGALGGGGGDGDVVNGSDDSESSSPVKPRPRPVR